MLSSFIFIRDIPFVFLEGTVFSNSCDTKFVTIKSLSAIAISSAAAEVTKSDMYPYWKGNK